MPDLRAGKTVLIAAHGNSLRALVKYLDGMSDEDVVGLNIPTGIPLRYDLDSDLKPNVIGGEYLDPEAASAGAAAVAAPEACCTTALRRATIGLITPAMASGSSTSPLLAPGEACRSPGRRPAGRSRRRGRRSARRSGRAARHRQRRAPRASTRDPSAR